MHSLISVLWKVPLWIIHVFLVSPIRWIWRKLPAWLQVLVLIGPITFGLLEAVTPAHTLASALYYESRGEPFIGRYAVAHVIYNRIEHPLWPSTIHGVVSDGLERGRSCDFSFMCDGKPENPWLHQKKYWILWLRSKAEALAFLALHPTGLLYDPTKGAVFYKRIDTYSPWFASQIKSGNMKKVSGNFGAHHFFILGH